MDLLGAENDFRQALERIVVEHNPGHHPFFTVLGAAPPQTIHNPELLGQLYLRYQAAMHATRVMAYHLPYLDSISMRTRKLQVLMDDDLTSGETHHQQLSRAFANLGAHLPLADEEFGALDDLQQHLDPSTARFLATVQVEFPRTLGPWCVVEGLADAWMRALMHALLPHFPEIDREPYFAECFEENVEERHARESLELTQLVLRRRPQLLVATVEGARRMACALDELWTGLQELVSGDTSVSIISR